MPSVTPATQADARTALIAARSPPKESGVAEKATPRILKTM
jgi:hypothetical protein